MGMRTRRAQRTTPYARNARGSGIRGRPFGVAAGQAGNGILRWRRRACHRVWPRPAARRMRAAGRDETSWRFPPQSVRVAAQTDPRASRRMISVPRSFQSVRWCSPHQIDDHVHSGPTGARRTPDQVQRARLRPLVDERAIVPLVVIHMQGRRCDNSSATLMANRSITVNRMLRHGVNRGQRR